MLSRAFLISHHIWFKHFKGMCRHNFPPFLSTEENFSDFQFVFLCESPFEKGVNCNRKNLLQRSKLFPVPVDPKCKGDKKKKKKRIKNKNKITLKSPCSFYREKWGLPWYTLVKLFWIQNIDCGYSLEPPQWGGSNEYPQSMLRANIREISQVFNWKFLSMSHES